MGDVFTPEECRLLRLCAQVDPVRRRLGIRSRLGTLMVLEDCIVYMDKDDSMRRAMVSLAEKLGGMSDTEFPGAVRVLLS